MTDLRPIEEEDLHAYVDGRLETERRGHVEQYLGQHPEAKARIQGWQVADQALRTSLAWRAEEPIPASLGLSHISGVRMTRRRALGVWPPLSCSVLPPGPPRAGTRAGQRRRRA
jgi:anti-sigma factor RsiW